LARELSLCAGAYITSNNALHAPKVVWPCFTVNLFRAIGDASQHSPKFFLPILAKQPFRQTFLQPKLFTIR